MVTMPTVADTGAVDAAGRGEEALRLEIKMSFSKRSLQRADILEVTTAVNDQLILPARFVNRESPCKFTLHAVAEQIPVKWPAPRRETKRSSTARRRL